MTPSPFARPLACALLLATLAGQALAQPPLPPPPPAGPPPAEDQGPPPPGPAPAAREGDCWAQVREPARYAPPPTGPEYVWTRAPAPPGAPGPVWCLTVRPMPAGPVMVAPEHLGWIRVLCADDATPARIERLQRGLSREGFYRGRFHGRYDRRTAAAVADFQHAHRIRHHGYLSYDTFAALEPAPPVMIYPPPPPPPIYAPPQTTFERGYLTWPGKSVY